MTRDALIADYDRLCRQLIKAGAEPVVSSAVLDAFSDEELMVLIKDCAFRLIRLRRLQT